MFKFILACTLLATVFGENTSPEYNPAPTSSYNPNVYDESPKPYNYQYAVNDDYTGVDFSAQESSDTKIISGSYKVALPDGRVQTVSYKVDEYSGYVADVQYEGTASFPKLEPKRNSYKPTPSPTPAYEA